MGWLMNLVLTLQVLSAIGIIVLVLLQQGKAQIWVRPLAPARPEVFLVRVAPRIF